MLRDICAERYNTVHQARPRLLYSECLRNDQQGRLFLTCSLILCAVVAVFDSVQMRLCGIGIASFSSGSFRCSPCLHPDCHPRSWRTDFSSTLDNLLVTFGWRSWLRVNRPVFSSPACTHAQQGGLHLAPGLPDWLVHSYGGSLGFLVSVLVLVCQQYVLLLLPVQGI
jgi:hypothetical protein